QTTELYSLSLHDALPISHVTAPRCIGTTLKVAPGGTSSPNSTKSSSWPWARPRRPPDRLNGTSVQVELTRLRGIYCAPWPCTSSDRKSTRLNSSHRTISY